MHGGFRWAIIKETSHMLSGQSSCFRDYKRVTTATHKANARCRIQYVQETPTILAGREKPLSRRPQESSQKQYRYSASNGLRRDLRPTTLPKIPFRSALPEDS